MSGLISTKPSWANDIVDLCGSEKPNRRLIASGVNRANGLQIGTLTIRALAQKMFSPACPAADFPAMADFDMVDHYLTHQKFVIIQCGAAVGGWDFIVGVFAQEPGALNAVSNETIVLGPSWRSPLQDFDLSEKKAQKTGNKMLLDHSHPLCGALR